MYIFLSFSILRAVEAIWNPGHSILLFIRSCHHGPRSQLSDVHHDKHPEIYRNIHRSHRSVCCQKGLVSPFRAVRFPSSFGISPVRRVTPKRRTCCFYFTTRECPCTVDLMSVLYLSTRQVITTLGYNAKSASEEVEKTVLTSPGRVVLSIFFQKSNIAAFLS